MPMPPLEQAIQWHKYRSSDPGIQWLRDLLRGAAHSMDGSLSQAKGSH
jgi:hypothetical protein